MTEFSFITKQIPVRRRCYIICERYDAGDFSSALAALCREATELGAAEIFFAARDCGQSFSQAEPFACGAFRFSLCCGFDILEKALSPAPEGFRPYRLKRLSADNTALYATLHNESFFDVPNAAFLDAEETDRLLADGVCEAGFFMDGGDPAGTYLLSRAGPVPEIAAIAVRKDLWGGGLGDRALGTLEQKLLLAGHARVTLTVCDGNARACALYKKNGYRFVRRLSTWFRADAGDSK